jgi:hypothetical protein
MDDTQSSNDCHQALPNKENMHLLSSCVSESDDSESIGCFDSENVDDIDKQDSLVTKNKLLVTMTDI